MDMDVVWAFLSTEGLDFAMKVLGAAVAWVIGRWVIGLLKRLTHKALERGRRIDETLAVYITIVVGVALNVLLVLAILDIFGVRTTSFAALLAGAGLAIGTAWGGLLTHFAAGVFLQVLRPYKVGDQVTVGGITGVVKELGLFGTTLVTGDSITALVGNNKVLSEVIQNFSTLPARRVDTTVKVDNSVNVREAMDKLREALARVPNVARPRVRKSRSCSSRLKARCWLCAPTPTPTITGRCTSTPTRPSSTPSPSRVIRCRKCARRSAPFRCRSPARPTRARPEAHCAWWPRPAEGPRCRAAGPAPARCGAVRPVRCGPGLCRRPVAAP